MKKKYMWKKYVWISLIFLCAWVIMFWGFRRVEKRYEEKKVMQEEELQNQSFQEEENEKKINALEESIGELAEQSEQLAQRLSSEQEEQVSLCQAVLECENQKIQLIQELTDLQSENQRALSEIEVLASSLRSQQESIAESIRQESIAESIRQESAAESIRQEQLSSSQPQVTGKNVYLTFDDGPSYLTQAVLDTLDQYGVKATFFVVYNPQNENLYKEIVNRGHAIGIHSTTHSYSQIYASYEAWLNDFTQIYNYVWQVTGVRAQLYRFPGGSNGSHCPSNVKEQAIAYLHSIGVEYFDWNVVCGDGDVVTAEESYNNVVSTINQRTIPVVLMHDGAKKETTLESLPRILQQLKDWGYCFAPLSIDVPPIHQGESWDY
ncbi:MAG: polysaccharide deacetylase family protein [Lachnospiraceae bacterium]